MRSSYPTQLDSQAFPEETCCRLNLASMACSATAKIYIYIYSLNHSVSDVPFFPGNPTHVPSGKQTSYWTSPFHSWFFPVNMVIFHSYVKLPEGKQLAMHVSPCTCHPLQPGPPYRWHWDRRTARKVAPAVLIGATPPAMAHGFKRPILRKWFCKVKSL